MARKKQITKVSRRRRSKKALTRKSIPIRRRKASRKIRQNVIRYRNIPETETEIAKPVFDNCWSQLMEEIDNNIYMNQAKKQELKLIMEAFKLYRSNEDMAIYISDAICETRFIFRHVKDFKIIPRYASILERATGAKPLRIRIVFTVDEDSSRGGDYEIYFDYNSTGELDGEYFSAMPFLTPERKFYRNGVEMQMAEAPERQEKPTSKRQRDEEDEEDDYEYPPSKAFRMDGESTMIPEDAYWQVEDEEDEEDDEWYKNL